MQLEDWEQKCWTSQLELLSQLVIASQQDLYSIWQPLHYLWKPQNPLSLFSFGHCQMLFDILPVRPGPRRLIVLTENKEPKKMFIFCSRTWKQTNKQQYYEYLVWWIFGMLHHWCAASFVWCNFFPSVKRGGGGGYPPSGQIPWLGFLNPSLTII